MVWRLEDPQGDESSKIKWELVPYTRGRVLDIGAGNHKPFAHFISVDNNKDAFLFGILCKPDLCMDAENLCLVADQSMDAVYSSHTLEHVEDPLAVLKHWWTKVKVGGYLILYLPHKAYYPNIGQPGANKDHKHDFLPQDVISYMEEVGDWDLVDFQERHDNREYSFYLTFRKLQWGVADQILMRFSTEIQEILQTSPVVLFGQGRLPKMDMGKCTIEESQLLPTGIPLRKQMGLSY